MIETDAIADLLRYDHWCTDSLAAHMEPLSSADLACVFPIGWGTLHASLYHLVSVAETWTDRSRPDPTGLRAVAYQGPAAVAVTVLRERYQTAGRQMLANLVTLHSTPQDARDVGWHIRHNHLIHITTHGMHHRAQMIFMLTQLGISALIEGGDFGGWANQALKSSVDRSTIARFLY